MGDLSKDSVSFWKTTAWAIAGILPIGALLGSISATGGYASPFVVLLAFLLVIFLTIPILEYTRLAKFAGGYYGAAELGFGKAVGKFVALTNYFYYIGWQVANATYVGSLLAVGYYAIYGTYPPEYSYFLIGAAALVVPFLSSILHVKQVSSIIWYLTIAGFIMNIIAFSILLYHSHYLSLNEFNPLYSPGGIHGAFLSLIAYGFFTFAGYGFLLFYTEEGKQPFKNTWRAAIIALAVSTIFWMLGAISVNSVFGPQGIQKAISFPQPGLLLYVKYLGPAGELTIIGILLILVVFSFASGVGAQGRILYSLARDDFLKWKWIEKLNKNNVPMNAMLFNFIVSLSLFIILGVIFVPTYGYFNAIFYMSYVPTTIATILWYFHHLIPDLSLSMFYRRNRISLTKMRTFIIAVLVPTISTGVFVYSLYESVISDLVEPYFAGFVISMVTLVFSAIYVVIKRNSLGKSIVLQNLNEEALKELRNPMETRNIENSTRLLYRIYKYFTNKNL